MADEDRRYTSWIRTQPCAVCGTTFQVVPHHAIYGTTYSPEEPRPPKSIEGARKGGAQRSHDYFSIPLCLKHHEPGVHQLGNFFAGKSRAWANAWEEEQVGKLRNRYAMQCPEPAAPAASGRKASGPRDAVLKERDRVVRVIRARAAERQHLPYQHQLLAELADDIAGGLNDTGAF
jgi:hypothetical protein